MTVDEELNILDDHLRRLKVEYDVFFGGGSKKPPADTEWRVQSLLKKFSDSGKLNFAQRFKYNSIAQKYAIFSDLWRQKLKVKEEGYRRPQDAYLGIQGLRGEQAQAAAAAIEAAEKACVVQLSEVEGEREQVKLLFHAMVEARKRAGEAGTANLDAFVTFVKKKTDEIRKQHHCKAVEYSIEVEDGKVKLKARAKL